MKRQFYWIFLCLAALESGGCGIYPLGIHNLTPTPTVSVTPVLPSVTPSPTATGIVPPATPTRTATSSIPPFTATPTVTVNQPSVTFTPTITPTSSQTTGFDTFDDGGAVTAYTNVPAAYYLYNPYNLGTTSQVGTCVTSLSHSPTHSFQDVISFDGTPGDIAEIGFMNWATFGNSVTVGNAHTNVSFWIQADDPVTIVNMFIAAVSPGPTIEYPNANIAPPVDGQWHQYVIPLGAPGAPWVFTSSAYTTWNWNTQPVNVVYFDMEGPVGTTVTVYYDDLYFNL